MVASCHRHMNPGMSIWRRRIGVTCILLGIILFSVASFVYLRYLSDPSNLHVEERLRYARSIGMLWRATFYGSPLLCIVSLFGLGWSRLSGLLLNGGVFLCTMMTLGESAAHSDAVVGPIDFEPAHYLTVWPPRGARRECVFGSGVDTPSLYSTGLRSTPMPSISTSTTSPGNKRLVLPGVPV